MESRLTHLPACRIGPQGPAELQALVGRQSAMPPFSGARGQVLKLNFLARKLSPKFGSGDAALRAPRDQATR